MSKPDGRNHEPRPEPSAFPAGPAGAAGSRGHPEPVGFSALLSLGLVEPDLVLADAGLRRHLAASVVPQIDDDTPSYLGLARLLGHPSTPAWLVDHVDALGDLGLRLAVLQGPHASPARCRALYRELRAGHPDLATVDLGSAAPIDEGDALAALAVHPKTPSDVLDEIVSRAPPRFVALVVGAAAGVPDILLSAWRRLRDARDAHPDRWLRVKRALAAHRETPAGLLCSLAGDDDPRA